MERPPAQQIRAYYDEWAEREWHRFDRRPADRVNLEIHRRFLARLIQPGDGVLEVGAGPVRFTIQLGQLGARITVTDISPRQLELNVEKVGQAGQEQAVQSRQLADVTDLSAFESGTFDVTIAYGGPLSYLFERVGTGLDELLRVTRPGGTVAFSVMSRWGTLAAETALSSMAPQYKPSGPLRFELESLPERRFRIHTNLDVAAVTRAMAQPSPGDRITVDPPLLASFLVSVHEGLAFASSFYSDVATSPLMSRLLRLKWASLLKQSEGAAKQIGQFQDFAFDDSRAIADAVRSGAVSFGDVLNVVERSTQFRRWLDGKENDANLVRDYFRECTKDTLFDRLPVAAARWVLVTGASTAVGAAIAGTAGVAAGVAVGAGDFLLGRAQQGWKPNHFVDRELKRLVR